MIRTALLTLALMLLSAAGCAKSVDPAPDYPVDDAFFAEEDFDLVYPDLATSGGDTGSETPESDDTAEDAE